MLQFTLIKLLFLPILFLHFGLFTDVWSRRPNVVLYLADDLGIGEICSNNKNCRIPPLPSLTSKYKRSMKQKWQQLNTPNIERLASRSTSFLRAYSPSSLCSPSRASIMLGRPVGYNNLRSNKLDPESTQDVEMLDASYSPFTHDLRELGYVTAMVGKWGLGTSSSLPWSFGGFDAFYGLLTNEDNHFAYPKELVLWDFNAKVKKMVKIDKNVQNEKLLSAKICTNPKTGNDFCVHSNDLYRKKALEWLQLHSTQDTKPLFLFWSATATHVGKYTSKTKLTAPAQRLGERLNDLQKNNLCTIGHAGSVEQHMDMDIGSLLDDIESNPWLEENTLIVFTADNGPYKKGVCIENPNFGPNIFKATNDLRGTKRTLYEGGLRVPMFLSWRGKIVEGRKSLFPVAGFDLATTILHAASQALPKEKTLSDNEKANSTRFINSRSLLSIAVSKAIRDYDYSVESRRYLQFELCDYGTENTCSVALLNSGAWNGASMLKQIVLKNNKSLIFDLMKDPFEEKNILNKVPSKVLREFERVRKGSRLPFPN